MSEYRKPYDKNRPPRPPKSKEAIAAAKASRASRYQIPAGTKIEYKNLPFLQKYVTDRGKIISRRITGISAKQQREIATAVRRARFLSLLQTGVKRR